MGIFGWSYPPGAENDPYAPYNWEPEDSAEDCPTVGQFCDHIGIEPIRDCLRAIDRHGDGEAIDIQLCGSDEWIGPADLRKLETVSQDDPIQAFRIRGIAWDGSDWEFCEIVDSMAPGFEFSQVDSARESYHDALAEHQALADEDSDD